jgi:hypothetical protein
MAPTAGVLVIVGDAERIVDDVAGVVSGPVRVV